MCGGRGSRFDADEEKPLFRIGGRPMVDRVRDALAASRVDTTYAVVSGQAPRTRGHLEGAPMIETPGDGYVEDLDRALRGVTRPALTVAADLPLLSGAVIDSILDSHGRGSLTVCVPAALKRRLGLSLDETLLERDGRTLAPAGLNVVDVVDEERRHVAADARVAVNVNRRADARVAEALL